MGFSQEQEALLKVIFEKAYKEMQYGLYKPFMDSSLLEDSPNLMESFFNYACNKELSFEKTAELCIDRASESVVKELATFIQIFYEDFNGRQTRYSDEPWIKYSIDITRTLMLPENDKA